MMGSDLRCPEFQDCDCRNDKLPVNSELVQDLLLHLDASKSTGPDGVNPRVLGELADVIMRHLNYFSMVKLLSSKAGL